MASIRDAFLAKDTVLFTVQTLRSIAALPRELGDLREKYVLPAFEFLPKIEVLQNAFATLGSDDSNDRDVAPVRRGTLYGIVRAGFASITLRQALVPLRNLSGDSVGQLIFDWMQSQLDRFRIELRSIERLQPPRAVDACITQIRLALADSGVQSCDPEKPQAPRLPWTVP